MEPFLPFLKAALLFVFVLLAAGFLAPRSLFSVAAISLKPSLLAASFVLGALLLVGGAFFYGSLALITAAVGTVFLAPFYQSSKPVAKPELTLVWANVMKRELVAKRAVALAEETSADLLILAEAPLTFRPPEGWHARSAHRPVLILSRTPGPAAEDLSGQRRGSVRLFHEGFVLYGSHLTMPLSGFAGPASRSAGLQTLAAAAREPSAIVVGDLNTVPWSEALLDLEERAGLERLGTGPKTTWLSPLLFLGLPIDHALAGEDVEATARIASGIGSDHRPLIVEARRRQP